MAKEKLTPSQIDGVDYRRAKLWQIILVAFNAFNGMAMYFLIGLASYSASIGYGIATLVVGGLLTFTRIFDAVTDPLLAFLYDRVNTPFGKVRPLMLLGWLIQSAGVYCLFNAFSSKGHGIPVFLACVVGTPECCASYGNNIAQAHIVPLGIPTIRIGKMTVRQPDLGGKVVHQADKIGNAIRGGK